jgi:hypothetical protein
VNFFRSLLLNPGFKLSEGFIHGVILVLEGTPPPYRYQGLLAPFRLPSCLARLSRAQAIGPIVPPGRGYVSTTSRSPYPPGECQVHTFVGCLGKKSNTRRLAQTLSPWGRRFPEGTWGNKKRVAQR